MTTLEEATELYERGEYQPPEGCRCTIFPCEHVLEEFDLLCKYCGHEPCRCEEVW